MNSPDNTQYFDSFALDQSDDAFWLKVLRVYSRYIEVWKSEYRYLEIARLRREQIQDERSGYGWKPFRESSRYRQYLKSNEWKTFRDQILAVREHRCERCYTKRGSMHVHHLHYRNLGHEKPGDVELLCGKCHKKAHSL